MNEPASKNDATESSSPAGPQFGLPALFYAMTVYCIGLIVWPWTIIWSTVVLVFWWMVARRTFDKVTGWTIVIVATTLFTIAFLVPVVHIRRSHPHTNCLNGVRQFMLAIINMESGRNGFPPAYTKDADGKPNLSWRVLILPNIEQMALYRQFNLNEPWDSPNNIKLLDQMPPIYSCWLNDAPPDHTPYKLVVDKGTLFEGGRIAQWADMKDGSSNTIGIVEDVQNPVPWTKPDDLTVEQAIAALSPKALGDVAHVRARKYETSYYGASVSLMDGSTHFIGPRIDPEVIRGWCLIDDGLLFDNRDERKWLVVTNWSSYFALALYGFLLVLPGLILIYKRITRRSGGF